MTPQFQDLVDNCFQACVASIMDLPLAEVPHFQEGVMALMDHLWTQERWDAVIRFGEKHGYEAFWLDPDLESDKPLIPRLHDSELFYLATGKSPLGKFGHCVVWYKGRMVHDPRHNGEGIDGEPWLYIAFERRRVSASKKRAE